MEYEGAREKCASDSRRLVLEQAAAFPLVSVTAWHMLFRLADLRPGEEVLIMGAGSGVGHMAIQMAKSAGARVFTTVGSDEKSPAKALGADEVINHSREQVNQRVRDLTQRRGVDVVIEASVRRCGRSASIRWPRGATGHLRCDDGGGSSSTCATCIRDSRRSRARTWARRVSC